MSVRPFQDGEYLSRAGNLLPYRGAYTVMIWTKWIYHSVPPDFWIFELYHRLEKYGA